MVLGLQFAVMSFAFRRGYFTDVSCPASVECLFCIWGNHLCVTRSFPGTPYSYGASLGAWAWLISQLLGTFNGEPVMSGSSRGAESSRSSQLPVLAVLLVAAMGDHSERPLIRTDCPVACFDWVLNVFASLCPCLLSLVLQLSQRLHELSSILLISFISLKIKISFGCLP